MNPQQFANMAGMGRGMPNNMNMMQNMNMNMGMGMNNMNQNQPQNQTLNAGQQKPPNFLQFIYQNLAQTQQNDGPFTGWRAAVSIQERAAQIKVLFDSLRMLGSNVETQRSLHIAIGFERKQFTQCPTQEAYKRSIHEKLASIRDQRQQQVASAANGNPNGGQMINPGGFQQMPNMSQDMNFPKQAGMQSSSMPNQNQVQQQQNMNPAAPLNRPVNNAANQQPNLPKAPELSKEDNMWINSRAAEMAKSTPREQMPKIAEEMNARTRQYLTEKNIDPIIYHFRMKATQEFRTMQSQGNRHAQPQVGMNMNRMPTPNQNNGISMDQANYDQFRNQQEEAIRQQQQGHAVVPASNPMQNMALGPNPLQRQQAQWMRQARAMNPQASDQAIQNMVAARMRQLQQQQAAGQINPANAIPPQPGQPQNSMIQQNGLNMLNQPFNQNVPSESPVQNVSRPQPTPQPGQAVGPGQPGQMTATASQIEAKMANLPPQLQSALKSRPKNEWPAVLAQFKQRQAQAHRLQQQQQQQQQNHQMQRSASQQGPHAQNALSMQQMQGSQFPGPSPMQASLSMGAEPGKQMQGMTPAQSQQQGMTMNAQQLMRLQQQQQQQQQQRMAQQNATGQQVSQEALIRETDNQHVPQQVLGNIAHAYSQAGQNFPALQTWHHLKEFTRMQATPIMPMNSVLNLQLKVAQNQRARMMAANGAQSIPQQGHPSQPTPAMAQQQSIPGSQPGPRPITMQDINVAKQRNPSWQNLGDEQVKQLLETHQGRAQSNNLANQPQVGIVAPSNNVKTANQQRSGPQTSQVNKPPALNQTQGPGQTNSATTKSAEPKGLKRPNQEDAAELSSNQQANKPYPFNVSVEQYEKMGSVEKENLVRERKKHGLASRIGQLTKEINEKMKKTPPITNMDPTTRQKIQKMLTAETTKRILERFDSFLLAIVSMETDPRLIKVLIQHRWHLSQQYTPDSWANKTYIPADQFTMNADNLEPIINQITQKFYQAAERNQNQQRAPVKPGTQQGAQSMPLTSENLNLASQQAAQQQKSKASKSKDAPPPAPTADKPPKIDWADNRGHGAPKYAPAGGLKPEDLKLPPKKKQRNDASASPATPSQPQPLPRATFRCPAPGCTLQPQGFGSQAELDAHKNTVHRPETESIKDPVGFLNNSLQAAFNLDEHLEHRGLPATARSVEKAPGRAGQTDAPAPTPAALSRGLSQQTGKGASPTVQRPRSTGQVSQPPPQSAQKFEDTWADTSFSFNDMVNVFGPAESGDVIPMAEDSEALLDKTYNAYMKTEDYKRVFGEPETLTASERSSSKSKSPEQGSEPSLPTNEAQKAAAQDPYFVDTTNALPELAENLEDFLWVDSSGNMLSPSGSLSSWEKIDKMEDAQKVNVGDDEFDLDSWIREPAPQTEFQEDEMMMRMLDEKTDWDALYASGDPSLYAGGTLAWNAIGKSGEELRRSLGWPLEGAAGKKTKGR